MALHTGVVGGGDEGKHMVVGDVSRAVGDPVDGEVYASLAGVHLHHPDAPKRDGEGHTFKLLVLLLGHGEDGPDGTAGGLLPTGLVH